MSDCIVFLRPGDRFPSLVQPTCTEHGRLNSGFLRADLAEFAALRHLEPALDWTTWAIGAVS